MTEIINDFPPNFEEIREKFRIKFTNTRSIVFTYGDKIYCPSGKPLSPDLLAHEETHVKQQSIIGPEQWWRQYFDDPKFRFDEELDAYRNQFKHIQSNFPRSTRRRFLKLISKDLAGPIYGHLCTTEVAEFRIKGEVK